jgi:hypothetical protein
MDVHEAEHGVAAAATLCGCLNRVKFKTIRSQFKPMHAHPQRRQAHLAHTSGSPQNMQMRLQLGMEVFGLADSSSLRGSVLVSVCLGLSCVAAPRFHYIMPRVQKPISSDDRLTPLERERAERIRMIQEKMQALQQVRSWALEAS